MVRDYKRGMSAVAIGKKYRVSSSYIYTLLNQKQIKRQQPQQYSHKWARPKTKSRRFNINPRIKLIPIKKFAHLSTDKLEKLMNRLAAQLEPSAIVESRDRIISKNEKRKLKVFDEVGWELARREGLKDE